MTDASTFKNPRGVEVRDLLTGFAGTVTGRADYITGCNQYLVQPPIDKDGKAVDPRWLDENRLVMTSDVEKRLVLDGEANDRGACEGAPIK